MSEQAFLKGAEQRLLQALDGQGSVGDIRASNSMAEVKRLA